MGGREEGTWLKAEEVSPTRSQLGMETAGSTRPCGSRHNQRPELSPARAHRVSPTGTVPGAVVSWPLARQPHGVVTGQVGEFKLYFYKWQLHGQQESLTALHRNKIKFFIDSLLYIKRVKKKDSPYSTGNYTQYLFFMFFTKVDLQCLLVSGMQQRDSVTYIYKISFFRFFSLIHYYQILSTVPLNIYPSVCLYNWITLLCTWNYTTL